MAVTLSDEQFDIYYDMTRSAMVVLLATGSPREAVVTGREQTGIVLVHNEEEYYFFLSGIPENEMDSLGYGRQEQLNIYLYVSKALPELEKESHCHMEMTMFLPNRVYTVVISPDKAGRQDMEEVFDRLHQLFSAAYANCLGNDFYTGQIVSVVTQPLKDYGMHIQKEFAQAMDCICSRRYFLQGCNVVHCVETNPDNAAACANSVPLLCADICGAIQAADAEKVHMLLQTLYLEKLKQAQSIELCNYASGKIFAALKEETITVSLHSGLYLEDYYLKILNHCLEYIGRLPKRSEHCSPEIIAADQYILEHFTDAVSLEELSRSVGFNLTYLCSKYKSEMGITIHARIQSLRLERAKELLSTTDMCVEKISYAAGFNDSGYFRRCFREKTGLKPIEYRNMAKNS